MVLLHGAGTGRNAVMGLLTRVDGMGTERVSEEDREGERGDGGEASR